MVQSNPLKLEKSVIEKAPHLAARGFRISQPTGDLHIVQHFGYFGFAFAEFVLQLAH